MTAMDNKQTIGGVAFYKLDNLNTGEHPEEYTATCPICRGNGKDEQGINLELSPDGTSWYCNINGQHGIAAMALFASMPAMQEPETEVIISDDATVIEVKPDLPTVEVLPASTEVIQAALQLAEVKPDVTTAIILHGENRPIRPSKIEIEKTHDSSFTSYSQG